MTRGIPIYLVCGAVAVLVAACGHHDTDVTAGGAEGTGAVGIGGDAGTGGAVPTGGVASGGVATGEVTTGGAATGGLVTGGVAAGGVAAGGLATGGVAAGGIAAGGVATGGTSGDGSGGLGTGGQTPVEPNTGGDTGTGPLEYKIGLSDVYILKRGRVPSLQYAEDVGADGVEADMGHLSGRETFYAKEGEELILDPVIAQQFVEDAEARGVECASVGMAGFLAWDLSDYPTFLTMIVPDTIRTMNNVGATVAYLPVRGTNLKENPDRRPGVIEQLKGAGALAVKEGVVFGIETTLDATEEAKLLDEIGSPGIKSYFNINHPLEEGRDVSEELKIHGRDRIVQLHVSDRDTMRDNIEAVRDTLEEMRWDGWLVIERAPGDGREGFREAVAFLKSIFPAEQ